MKGKKTRTCFLAVVSTHQRKGTQSHGDTTEPEAGRAGCAAPYWLLASSFSPEALLRPQRLRVSTLSAPSCNRLSHYALAYTSMPTRVLIGVVFKHFRGKKSKSVEEGLGAEETGGKRRVQVITGQPPNMGEDWGRITLAHNQS